MQLNARAITRAKNIFKAFSNKRTSSIIELLEENKNGLTVTEIVEETKMLQSNVSNLLSELKRLNLVTENRNGRSTTYTFNSKVKRNIEQSLDMLLAS